MADHKLELLRTLMEDLETIKMGFQECMDARSQVVCMAEEGFLEDVADGECALALPRALFDTCCPTCVYSAAG